MSYAALAIIFALVFLLIVFGVLVFSKNGDPELRFFPEGPVVFVSAFVSVAIIALFLFFRENEITIPDGLGQVGDFIGGLTNPILSFVALIVLLRSTSIQTKIYKRESFRSEFYALLGNVADGSKKYAKPKYVKELINIHRNGRVEVQNELSGDKEGKAKSIIVGSIEHGRFEQFAIAVRIAIQHIVEADIPDALKYNYAVILRDALTKHERILLLNWAYFYWPTAKCWLQKYPFARGLKAEKFIIDDVHKFFTAIKN